MLFRYMRRNLGADAADAEALGRELGVMTATAEILIGRGIATPEACRAFFSPGMASLREPMGLVGMGEAVERVGKAVAAGESIVVYGDYDVDGVCSASILAEYLLGCGARCEVYIPSRHTEGYGLNAKAVESLAGAQLLITVDCGVSNAAEVALARSLGMDVIVTDHHECPDALPDCIVLNPKRPGQAYGFSGLCGAGMALKLVQAMGGPEAVEQALDLAALATVADIVPLVDENRAIVRMGIEQINTADRPGIVALKEVAGLEGKPVRAGSIGFMLAPRINAGGRMDLSRKSVELMLTKDITRAREIARELNDDNADRVKVEEGILKEAVELIDRGYSFSRQRAIVLYRPHWNTGVTGIVASRIVERYHRPAFLFGDGEGACYGSGRSVPGVHLYNAMKACSDWFIRFGGHEQAAGCAMLAEHIDRFARALDSHLAGAYPDEVFLPLRHYDAELAVNDLTIGLARDMDKLEPCGFGNPRPVFLLSGAELSGLSRTADGKHLRMRLRGGVEGIAFRQGGMHDALAGASRCDILAVPSVNEWMGRERVQAVVEHIKPPQGHEHACNVLLRAAPLYQRALVNAARSAPAESDTGLMGFTDGVEAFLRAMRKSPWGALALCFTASGAAAVLATLVGAGLEGRVFVDAGIAGQAARKENALVVAPDLERLDAGGYDSVFIFDGLLAGGCSGQIAQKLNASGNCFIIDVNHEFWLPHYGSREELLKVYRCMKAALEADAGPCSPMDWEWLSGAESMLPWRAEVSARIFLELGLLRELNKPPWLRAQEPPVRANLQNSAIYKLLETYRWRCSSEPEGQGARDTGLPDARHSIPGYHDADEGRAVVRGIAGQDA